MSIIAVRSCCLGFERMARMVSPVSCLLRSALDDAECRSVASWGRPRVGMKF